jgi:hypothetical protein
MMLERGNKVAHIQRIQHNEFVLNFFEQMNLENLTTIVIIVIEQMLCKEGFVGTQRDGRYFRIECSVDLFFYQLLTFIHSLSAPPIYTRVNMHTKVNRNSQNRLLFMDNIINSTFTWVDIGRHGVVEFASEGRT